MNTAQKLITLALLSSLVTTVVYPFVLRYALKHRIVDNPDARKLHRLPVPVMGGVAVYAGILAGCLAMSILVSGASISWSIMAMTIMLVLGVWDDINNLPAIFRLIVQFGIVGAYMVFTGYYIDNFYGLFGIHEISLWVGIPLSLVAGVGTINAINMIDGIDGYSSGYCIMACVSFAVVFIAVDQSVWSCLAVIVASALFPFFMHNVFGKKTKMFIGDGGTLMMGMLMTIFTLHTVDNTSRVAYNFPNMGVVAFCISVLSVPVFDTLRVMSGRIMKGVSPFHADKSHLHHLFIEIGFSHVGTAVSVITLNVLNILCWLATYQLGGDATVQFLVVVAVGLLNTNGFYYVVRRMNHEQAPYKALKRLAELSHIETGPFFHTMRSILDRI